MTVVTAIFWILILAITGFEFVYYIGNESRAENILQQIAIAIMSIAETLFLNLSLLAVYKIISVLIEENRK